MKVTMLCLLAALVLGVSAVAVQASGRPPGSHDAPAAGCATATGDDNPGEDRQETEAADDDHGGAGHDVMDGRGGDDHLSGGAGDDDICGDAG